MGPVTVEPRRAPAADARLSTYRALDRPNLRRALPAATPGWRPSTVSISSHRAFDVVLNQVGVDGDRRGGSGAGRSDHLSARTDHVAGYPHTHPAPRWAGRGPTGAEAVRLARQPGDSIRSDQLWVRRHHLCPDLGGFPLRRGRRRGSLADGRRLSMAGHMRTELILDDPALQTKVEEPNPAIRTATSARLGYAFSVSLAPRTSRWPRCSGWGRTASAKPGKV
jgi:hypothetical protein